MKTTRFLWFYVDLDVERSLDFVFVNYTRKKLRAKASFYINVINTFDQILFTTQ